MKFEYKPFTPSQEQIECVKQYLKINMPEAMKWNEEQLNDYVKYLIDEETVEDVLGWINNNEVPDNIYFLLWEIATFNHE